MTIPIPAAKTYQRYAEADPTVDADRCPERGPTSVTAVGLK